MRFFVLGTCLLFALLCCDARRRRKTSKTLAGSQSTNPGKIQESLSSGNHSASLLNKPYAAVGKSTDTALSSLVKSSKKVVTKRQKRKRKSRRNRKSRKQRKYKKKSRKHTGRTSPKGTKTEFDIFDKTKKELLRSTMRRMFGFDHMTGPRVNQKESAIDESHFAKTPRSHVKDTSRSRLMNPLDQMNSQNYHTLPNPPDFMLELYRTYSEDKSLMRINAQSQGNTIRSFFSVAGETMSRLEDKEKPLIITAFRKIKSSVSQSDDFDETNANQYGSKIKVFAFNVTSIPATESIVAAELRLDGLRKAALSTLSNPRPQNVSRSGWSADVAVYKVANSNKAENESRKIYQRVGRMITIRPSGSFAWVDRRIARLSSKARREKHVLIVKFNHDVEHNLARRRRSTTSSTENSSYRSHATPKLLTSILPNYFVVVRSDRRKRNTGASYNHPRSASSASPASLAPILIVYCNDTKTVVSATDAPIPNGIWGTLGNFSSSSVHKRTRRSSNRRLPGHSLLSSSGENKNEIPGETQGDDASGRVASQFPTVTDNDQTELHDNGQVQRRVIQQLQDRKAMTESKKGQKRKRGKKCRKRGRKGRRSRKCRKEKAISTPEPDLNRAQQVCSRKSLHVDFNDIGWSDWIISPKNFDAYYCSGLCELNTMKRARPSNHAIVQAFIKSFQINPEVPAPCCVPDKLMSLSVLYFDRNDNVVLKVYPDMSVESCSCR